MAKKDWKKVNVNSWFNKNKEIRLDIERGKNEEEYPFGVSIHSTFIVAGGDKYLEGFDTKLQALKFAKSYMRNN